MALAYTNNLLRKTAAGAVCKAFGVRLVNNPQVVQLAANSGFDSLFIDLEHSTLTEYDASILSTAGLHAGITPIVRVPYQCGSGYVQRVLDGGAMGVIFPHIHSAKDAAAAVAFCKYPPTGTRSLTGQVPYFSLRPVPPDRFMTETNANASSVLLMIETASSIANIDAIAAVPGADVLLIGSNDLSVELGVPGQFKSDAFRSALEAVSAACHRHGKVFGLAGIYNNAELHDWALNTLGARYILVQQDSGILAWAGKECAEAVESIAAKK